MTPQRPHIIAAKLPSGMTSRPHEHGDHIPPRDGICSVGRHGGEKAGHPSNVDLERLYASYADDRPDLYRCLVDARDDPPLLARVTLVDAIVMILVAVFIGVLLGTGGGF